MAGVVTSGAFEAEQRSREYFHGLRVLPGAFTVIRVDGRSFSRLTVESFEKPFDPLFSDHMVAVASALVVELEGVYAYTESDEVSVLLPRRHDMFGRSVEKLASVSAGIASAAFTHAHGRPAHFDSRLWVGAGVGDVIDYFSWRQADAARCALNGWCYWVLRGTGMGADEATRALSGTTVSDRNELLFQHGTNFNDVPAWQRRGIGVRWEPYEHSGRNPITEETLTVRRRRLSVDTHLPMGEDYRAFVGEIAGP